MSVLQQAHLAFLASVLGAILGSFIATLCLRWPEGERVSAGRSRCDSCGRTLGAADLIPLVSAVAARGRCRTCHAAIDPFHFRVELAAMAIGAISLLAMPGVQGFALAVFGWLLLPLLLLDWRHYWLPDRLTFLLAAAGLAAGGLLELASLEGRLIGGAVGFVVLWVVGWAYRQLRGREGLGAGDPKLFGALGLWLGWAALPSVLLLAAVFGLLIALLGSRATTMASALPFGALLAIAAWLYAFNDALR